MSTSTALLLPTLRTRKPSVSLTSLLRQEYLSRYGTPPPPDPAWQREPWCGEVLRVLEGPVVEPEAAPCTS